MEKTFFKNVSGVYGGIFATALTVAMSFVLTVIGILNNYVQVFIPVYFLALLCVIALIKELFRKLKITTNGVEFWHKKSKILCIAWNEITDIQKNPIIGVGI